MSEVPFSDDSGYLIRYESFGSDFIEPRNLDVWLPPGYTGDPEVRFPVIYMHDGQNLFDPGISYIGVDWGVDEAVNRLSEENGSGAIIVGIWNNEHRWRDYMPQEPLETSQGWAVRKRMIERVGEPPASDRYLRFLVEEVKPLIDATYCTMSDRAHTFTMGSSLGGLISLYALVRYPQVFGGAGCVSTAWSVGGKMLVDYFGAVLPWAGKHRLYFDYGTEGLDAGYESLQLRMDARMAARGFTRGQDWLTEKFPGAEHSERAWRARVDVPLRFLLS
jgi:predicted alpha/beta superfamily hydrolase